MRRLGFALVASLLIGCSSSPPVGPAPTTTTPDALDVVIPELADHGGKAIISYLSAPVTGDQTGTLRMSSNAGQDEVCYALQYVGTMPRPTTLRVYRGSPETPGGQVLTFAAARPLYACVSGIGRDFVHDIARYPSEYGADVYVDATVVLRGRFEHLKQPYR